MKNALFTILLFSISLIGYSQPTLTIDSQSPVIGTSFEAAVVSENFDSLIVDIGTSGPDQFWDFSQYTDFNTGQFTFIEATEAPCIDSFPDANFALAISQNAADTLFVYYGIQEDTIARLGTVSGCGTDSELINYFSQPEQYYQLPATFGSSYNFSSTNQTIFNGVEVGMTASEVSVMYDGYGDITTQYGTYEDVLRIVITSTFGTDFTRTEIRWVQANQFWPVCIYINLIEGDDDVAIETLNVYDLDSGTPNNVSKLETLDFGVSLIQNPVNQQLRLQGVEQVPPTAKWMIINSVGQQQLVKPSPSIDVTNAAKGLNYLVIRTADAQQVIPFLVL